MNRLLSRVDKLASAVGELSLSGEKKAGGRVGLCREGGKVEELGEERIIHDSVEDFLKAGTGDCILIHFVAPVGVA